MVGRGSVVGFERGVGNGRMAGGDKGRGVEIEGMGGSWSGWVGMGYGIEFEGRGEIVGGGVGEVLDRRVVGDVGWSFPPCVLTDVYSSYCFGKTSER